MIHIMSITSNVCDHDKFISICLPLPQLCTGKKLSFRNQGVFSTQAVHSDCLSQMCHCTVANPSKQQFHGLQFKIMSIIKIILS